MLAVVAPGFFTFANQRDLVLANMPVLIVALGMVLVILTGQIDISVGSQFAICSVAAGVFARMGLPTPLAGAAACLVGALMGGDQRRAGGVGADSVDRGDAGHDGGAARRPALGDAGRVGAGSAAGLSVVRTIAGGERADHRRHARRRWRWAMNWGLRNLAAGRVVYATGIESECGAPGGNQSAAAWCSRCS